jgi:hypothetical protein
MGIYLFEKGDFTIALANFEKAKALDNDTMWVDDYMEKTKQKLLPVMLPVAKKRKTVTKAKKPTMLKLKKSTPGTSPE